MNKLRRFVGHVATFFRENFIIFALILMMVWFISVWRLYVHDLDKLQAYATYGTAVGTAVLALATYLMARSTRHMAQEVRLEREQRRMEEHLNDQRAVMRQWLDEWKPSRSPYETFPFTYNSSFVMEPMPLSPLSLPLENDVLFNDLEHHVPQYLSDWQEYKQKADTYESLRRRLAEGAIRFVTEATGLQVRDYNRTPPAEEAVWSGLVTTLISDLSRMCEGKSPEYLTAALQNASLEKTDSMFKLQLGGTYVLRASSEGRCQDILGQVTANIGKDTELRRQMAELQRVFEELEQLRDALRRRISDRVKTPLPLKDCPELRRTE